MCLLYERGEKRRGEGGGKVGRRGRKWGEVRERREGQGGGDREQASKNSID